MDKEKNQSVRYEKRPFRRRSKENPYRLLRESETGKCYVQFRDIHGVLQTVEVEKAVYDAFERFELDDLSALNEADRHGARESLEEAEARTAGGRTHEEPEALWLRRESAAALDALLRKLPDRQRRRLLLHDQIGLPYREIARIEGCSLQAAARSVQAARKRMRKLLSAE